MAYAPFDIKGVRGASAIGFNTILYLDTLCLLDFTLITVDGLLAQGRPSPNLPK